MIRSHPVISAVMIGCILAGAVLGYALFTSEWSSVRRILAGVLGGAGVGLIITTTRMIG